eukprot:TRINITY_DN3038_c0_g1_i3.p1 TRINITY_DN3038_c0_g1~~TRINITY_DN3038_c0_g1_i3.p1  ORF type:complete len:192 (-),score=52.10 TRINITY_DN3038_c0_g1_i3:72-647(-)
MRLVLWILAVAVPPAAALSRREDGAQNQCLHGLKGKSEAELCTALLDDVKRLNSTGHDPVDADCREPEEPGKDVEGLGLTKVHCCSTAKKKVKELEMKQARCAYGPPVPCWKSLAKVVLPSYTDYYKKQQKLLCPPPDGNAEPPTTTTTTTTHPAEVAWFIADCQKKMGMDKPEECIQLSRTVAANTVFKG